MPTHVIRGDGSSEEAKEVYVTLTPVLPVMTVVITHGSVSFYDNDHRESILIQHGTHPGAGMDVSFADHVQIEDQAPTQTGG